MFFKRTSLKFRLFKILSIIAVLTVLFITTITPMSTKLDIDALDKKIGIIDYVALGALVITLVSAIFALYYKNEQNELLKSQRQKDQLNIATANEQSESAKRDAAVANEKAAISNERAANAELKSKQTEIELLKLRLAVADRFIPDNVKEVLNKELKGISQKKVLILCAISNNDEPINFSNKLNNYFLSIGWNSEVRNQSNIIMPAPTGFIITAFGESNKKIAKLIYQQFSEIKYECRIVFNEQNEYDLFIQVWAK